MASYVYALKKEICPDPTENVFVDIWSEYEKVIVKSLVTSFWLDKFINDQQGGDVDTIHNVRQIGTDPKMNYKNKENMKDYDQRGEYNQVEYHQGDKRYQAIRERAKREYDEKGILQKDGYVDGNKLSPYRDVPIEKQGQLDHIIPAKEIHDDRGRLLAGLDGNELANSEYNLVYTNAALNNNMRDKSPEEYIRWCEENPDKVNYRGKQGEPLPEDVKEKIREEYKKTKKIYDAKLAKKYYTSPSFYKDTTKAAGLKGAAMGLRQALGFVFMELWEAVKNELNRIRNTNIESIIKAAGRGIKKGFENAKKKYKEILEKMKEGFVSGALASLTTTIINTFNTTAKNVVKNIRQIYSSVVEAGKILFFNPDNLPFGDRVKSATIILATGASVLLGGAIEEIIRGTVVGKLPVIGDIVSTFCGTLVSGVLSCTLLIFLDRSKFMNDLFDMLNGNVCKDSTFKEIADAMEAYAAELAKLDIDKFERETELYSDVSKKILSARTEKQLNKLLFAIYEQLNIQLPWTGDFDEFMSDKNNHLIYS